MTATTFSSAQGSPVPDATLPEGCDSPFDLLRVAKRAGRHFGLGPQDLHLLELYVCLAKREDWAEGRRPMVTRPVHRTAAALGVSPRSVNTAERRLERLGLIRRATRADGARGGWGGRDGGPLYGIDLTPLIAAQPALNACIDAARARTAQAEALRAAISRHLGEARRIMMTVTGGALAAAMALVRHLPTRTPQGQDIDHLGRALHTIRKILIDLKALCRPVDNSADLSLSSDAPEENSPPLYTTMINPDSSCNTAKREHGLQHLKTRDISRAMPDEWHDLAGTQPGQFLWNRFTMAAERRLAPLGVSTAIWREATTVMGQEAAALSLMLLDSNRNRPSNPVRNVAGALRAMTRRAERDRLRLHASVYGLLARAGQSAEIDDPTRRSVAISAPVSYRSSERR